jgi:antitoxin VapB
VTPDHEATVTREAKLFRNNKSQAVRIPADFELPGDRVMIHREEIDWSSSQSGV